MGYFFIDIYTLSYFFDFSPITRQKIIFIIYWVDAKNSYDRQITQKFFNCSTQKVFHFIAFVMGKTGRLILYLIII